MVYVYVRPTYLVSFSHKFNPASWSGTFTKKHKTRECPKKYSCSVLIENVFMNQEGTKNSPLCQTNEDLRCQNQARNCTCLFTD